LFEGSFIIEFTSDETVEKCIVSALHVLYPVCTESILQSQYGIIVELESAMLGASSLEAFGHYEAVGPCEDTVVDWRIWSTMVRPLLRSC